MLATLRSMDVAVASLVSVVAAVLTLSLALWDTKIAPPLDTVESELRPRR